MFSEQKKNMGKKKCARMCFQKATKSGRKVQDLPCSIFTSLIYKSDINQINQIYISDLPLIYFSLPSKNRKWQVRVPPYPAPAQCSARERKSERASV
jgi:hypothetical protein